MATIAEQSHFDWFLIGRTVRNISNLHIVHIKHTLQIKGWWESDINFWFPFMYSQKRNCYFKNRTLLICLPNPKLIYLWEIYIFTGSVCLFCCREICGPILGIYKSLTDTWMWKLSLRPRNAQKRNTKMGFSLQCTSILCSLCGGWQVNFFSQQCTE